MKKTTLVALATAALLGLGGCVNMDPTVSASGDAMANMSSMQKMQRECKNYLSSKFGSLPMAAFSVRPGYSTGAGKYTIPVSINWDDPKVKETGACYISNGIVRSYKANY